MRMLLLSVGGGSTRRRAGGAGAAQPGEKEVLGAPYRSLQLPEKRLWCGGLDSPPREETG